MLRTLTLTAAVLACGLSAGVGVAHLGGVMQDQPMRESGVWSIDRMDDILARHAERGEPYLRLLDEPTLSTGLYILPAGGVDHQTPHRLDEVYYIITGRATFVVDGQERPARAGDVIFVKRGVDHRFTDIEEEMHVLVFFSKAHPDSP